MKLPLHARYSLVIVAVIVIITLTLAGALLFQFRVSFYEMIATSSGMMAENLLERAKTRGKAIVRPLAANLVDPVYLYDMKAMYELLFVTKQQQDVIYAYVYDEKVANDKTFTRQRTRWIAAQIRYGMSSFGDALKHLILKGNVDYFDKSLQFLLLPRLILLGALVISVPVGYAMPKDADLLVDVVNVWLALKQQDGTVKSLYDYWVQGKVEAVQKPRWSIIRDVLQSRTRR